VDAFAALSNRFRKPGDVFTYARQRHQLVNYASGASPAYLLNPQLIKPGFDA
jgi:hypothetical protein